MHVHTHAHPSPAYIDTPMTLSAFGQHGLLPSPGPLCDTATLSVGLEVLLLTAEAHMS
jgi:hypothetical protein